MTVHHFSVNIKAREFTQSGTFMSRMRCSVPNILFSFPSGTFFQYGLVRNRTFVVGSGTIRHQTTLQETNSFRRNNIRIIYIEYSNQFNIYLPLYQTRKVSGPVVVCQGYRISFFPRFFFLWELVTASTVGYYFVVFTFVTFSISSYVSLFYIPTIIKCMYSIYLSCFF